MGILRPGGESQSQSEKKATEKRERGKKKKNNLRGREGEREEEKAVTLSSSWIQPSLKLDATYMSQYILFYT